LPGPSPTSKNAATIIAAFKNGTRTKGGPKKAQGRRIPGIVLLTHLIIKYITVHVHELKSASQVVGDVLAENTKKNQFLQNVGFQNARPRSSKQNTEAEREVEKRADAELRV
jgi:hypothetical protein